MGRWRIDNYILYYFHKYELNVVDMTLLISAHQGNESAIKHRSEVTKDDFLWNFRFLNSSDISSGLLTSNYFVVYYYLLYNSIFYDGIDKIFLEESITNQINIREL